MFILHTEQNMAPVTRKIKPKFYSFPDRADQPNNGNDITKFGSRSGVGYFGEFPD